MFIVANWWELYKETSNHCKETIIEHSLENYKLINEPTIYQHKDNEEQYISWLEFVANPIEKAQHTKEIEASFIGELKCDVGDANKSSQWIYIVHTDIPEDIVEEYNRWYDEEHLPRLVTVPGVNRARRYLCSGQTPKYLTAYGLDEPNAFESPEGLIARKTPWTAKMRALFFNTRRTMAKKI